MSGHEADPTVTIPSGLTTRRIALGRIAGGTLAAAIATGASGVGRAANARQATPPACAGGPELGTSISFIGVEGIEIGQLTVTEITDPFTGYRPNYPPARGNRFIMLGVTVENTGANPWQFDPNRIILQDGEGFLTYPTGVDLGDAPVVPAFTYQEVPPGASASGVVGYTMLRGVTPIRVLYMPAGDRLLFLAALEL
jgi:hypothetical protein